MRRCVGCGEAVSRPSRPGRRLYGLPSWRGSDESFHFFDRPKWQSGANSTWRASMYFYRTYDATVSGSTTRKEWCVGCSSAFEYNLSRTAVGGGHSGYFLNNLTAELNAKQRAKDNLQHALVEDVEPVACPVCGIFQPAMVTALRERVGRRCEPNRFASERMAAPAAAAWNEARSLDTLHSRTRFGEIWPNYAWLATDRLREIRHPRLRRLRAIAFLVLWGALASLCVALIVLSILGDR